MAYTIQGQSGKSMNATARSPETLRIINDQLRFESLGSDYFAYTSIANDATGAGVTLPETGQTIELFKDGVRKFKGTVTQVIPGTKGISVRADGPWWWMNKINLSGDFVPPFDSAYGGGAATSVRHNYGFPQQDLQTSLIALINRAIALGVPMTLGSVASMFIVMPITLANMSVAAALAEMLRYCPDAVVKFDYANATPEISIFRRGTMTPLAFEVGVDVFEDMDLRPRTDLKISRVEVNFTNRHPTTQKPRFGAQVAGTATTGEIQIVTVSGPERVDFLPPDKGESFYLKTALVSNSMVMSRDPGLLAIFARYGTSLGYYLVPSYGFDYHLGTLEAKDGDYHVIPAGYTITRDDGVIMNNSTPIITSTGTIPSWVTGLAASNATVSGWLLLYKIGDGIEPPFDDLWRNYGSANFGYYNNANYDSTKVRWVYVPVSFQVQTIATSYATGTTLYKPPSYVYAAPPAGLAANYLACQNFVPWEGSFTLADNDLGLTNLLQRTININSALPACASMAAMPRSITYEIGRGRRKWQLGTPARSSLGSLVNRVRQSPDDVITYL